MPAPAPLFSVVIPTHNNRPVLERCINSWRSIQHFRPVELLIIEDGCTDDTAEYLKSETAKNSGNVSVRTFHEDDVHELRCDNRGFRESRGQFLIAWQDDMFVQKDWMLPELHRTFTTYPEIGLIALSRGTNCYWKAEPIERWDQIHDWDRLKSTIGPRFWNWFYLFEVDSVVRPWVVTRACIEKHGPLDEAFVPCEWDEADLCFRIREAGWKVSVHGYEREGAYHHLGSSTNSKMPSGRHQSIILRNAQIFQQRWQTSIQRNQHRNRVRWPRRQSVLKTLLAIARR